MTHFTTITQLLDSHNIAYKHIHHPPKPTSQDSARERWEPLEIWAKALLLKWGDEFFVVIMSAAKQLDSKLLKSQLWCKTRFATREELYDLTWLVPGCVPPVGRPVFDYDCYIDQSILSNEKIAFNAWSLTDSLILNTQDRLSVIEYKTIDCSM
jgi:Ala-tRNA(Pro) deacylase